MKRTRLVAVAAATAAGLLVGGAPGGAQEAPPGPAPGAPGPVDAVPGAAQDEPRFERAPVPSASEFDPASLDPGREVTVMVELEEESTTEQEARTASELPETEEDRRAREIESRQRGQIEPQVEARGGEVVATYQRAYNGLRVRIPAGQALALAEIDGVAAVRRLQTFEPTNAVGVPYVGAPAVWEALELTGEGTSVAIIDTGVDYYHAAFGGSGDPADFAADDPTVVEPGTFPTARVVGGYDFAGDDYNASADGTAANPGTAVPSPDPDPLDCQGHGTHVAGSAAGGGVLPDGSPYAGPYGADTPEQDFLIGPGSAPEAQVFAYRVFGCDGSTDLTVDAIERAVEDGVDVINMSLGSTFGDPLDPTSQAASNAAAAGVVVVASAGNEGPGSYVTGSPGAGSQVISVAAMDAVADFPVATISSPSGDIEAINANGADLSTPVTGTSRVLVDPATGGIALGCSIEEYADVQPGEVVVTKRGVCARTERAVLGQQAGAAAVVMVDTSPQLPPFEGAIAGADIPFLGVAGADEAAIAATDGQSLTVTDAGVVANPAFGDPATFTSAGPALDNSLKPDVTAPGVAIQSAAVGTGSGGTRLSGTSMAAPITAGVAALVAQARPDWTPAQVKAVLMSTADASADALTTDEPTRVGAGLVDALAATTSVAYATTGPGLSSVSFGLAPAAGPVSETRTITVSNTGTRPLAYDLAAAFSGDDLGAEVAVAPASVTVPAGSSAAVELTLTMSAAAATALPAATGTAGDVPRVQGSVVATPRQDRPGAAPLRVPFLVVPRAVSDAVVDATSPYSLVRRGVVERTATVTNRGVHAATVDTFALGLTDVDEGLGEVDLRGVGVQALPARVGGLPPSDRLLVFAVSTHAPWSTASIVEHDVVVDTNGDGAPDKVVIGIDFGLVATGIPDGTYGSFVVDVATGAITDAYVADAPPNGSVALLPVPASALGLSSASPSFTYTASSFSLLDARSDSVPASAPFDAYAPPISQGDLLDLAPGESGEIPQVVSRRLQRQFPQAGWMFVTLDDAAGAAQADIVPVGRLNGAQNPGGVPDPERDPASAQEVEPVPAAG